MSNDSIKIVCINPINKIWLVCLNYKDKDEDGDKKSGVHNVNSKTLKETGHYVIAVVVEVDMSLWNSKDAKVVVKHFVTL